MRTFAMMSLAFLVGLAGAPALASQESGRELKQRQHAVEQRNERADATVLFTTYGKARPGEWCADLTCPRFLITGISF